MENFKADIKSNSGMYFTVFSFNYNENSPTWNIGLQLTHSDKELYGL